MRPVTINGHASFFGTRFLFTSIYYIQVTIRFFRLHALTQWLHEGEKPKVAMYHDRGVALIQSVVHLVPLTVVVAFMVLNIRSWYWGDPSTTVLTALQFAAKVLEIMMQTSLGTILMSLVRHQLLGDRGLPLGSFLGPYSIADISYLWSLEFWGGVTSKHAHVAQRLVFGVVISALVILASLVGPSIAVLLIPRPIDYTTGHYLAFLDEQATIFPDMVDMKGENLTNEDAFRYNLFKMVRNDNDAFLFTDQNNLSRTMPSYNQTPLFFPDPDPINASATLPGTLMSEALMFQGLTFFSGISGGRTETSLGRGDFAKSTTFQPYVQENCRSQWLNDTQDPNSTYITFGDISPEATNLTFAVLIDLIHSGTPENSKTSRTTFAWDDAPPPSNHSVLTIKGVQLEKDLFNNGANDPANAIARAEACVIDAIWATTVMNGTWNAELNWAVNFELGSSSSQKPKSQLIKISPDWASKVLHIFGEYQPNVTDIPQARLFSLALAGTAPMPDVADGYGSYGWKEVHASPRFSGDEADAVSLSRVQYDAARAYLSANRGILSKHTDVFFYAAANWTDPGKLYHYEFETYRQGYGYDSSSVPVLLSLIVVATYALIAVVHLLYTLVIGRVGKSWDTLAELLLLGLHSQPPGVAAAANTTVGIETIAPFQEPVGVRLNENGRVEMLFYRDALNKQRALNKVKVNEAY